MVKPETYGWPHSQIEGPPVWEDASFTALLGAHPALATLPRYLPRTPGDAAFEGQAAIDLLPTSYKLRGYGALLYAMVRALRPGRIAELGIFEGFSLLCMAAALRDNASGVINGYDLFDAYPYRHSDRAEVTGRVRALGLDPWVRIDAQDAFEVDPEAVDILHVDISNNGETYRRMFERWSPAVRQVIIFEGGSGERDNVEWMRVHGKPAIEPAIDELKRAHPAWQFTVLPPFPSMTVACRKA